MVSVIFDVVSMILLIGTVVRFKRMTKAAVAVVEVYSAAVTAREFGLYIPPPSSVNADDALILSSVRAIWMLWKVESAALLAMDVRVLGGKLDIV